MISKTLTTDDVGYQVLKIISKRLIETTRVDDTVSRHGGGEFLYLIMTVDSKQIEGRSVGHENQIIGQETTSIAV